MKQSYRLARSLEVLRSQIDASFSNRSRRIDGWIGDAAHRARTSDHNPNRHGVVTAIDLTHDPANFDAHTFANHLRVRRDHRIKYVISRRVIFSSTNQPWVWRVYQQTPHDGHVHISCSADPQVYDRAHAWHIDFAIVPPPVDLGQVVLRRGSTGADVQTVQRLLAPLQPADLRPLVADGIFGPATSAAVRNFQTSVGITADGVVGPITFEHLDLIETEPLP